jgi:hypothetical protein
MTQFGGQGAKRVLLCQALGGDEFLRVTWHERNDMFVFSHWESDTCVAATPVRVAEMGDLATMIVTALAQRVTESASQWPAPPANTSVSNGLARPA